ncbi:MAG: sodium-dependent transporter [Pseudomonadota bacterium]
MTIGTPAQEQWSNRGAFLMASIGFAVGLGNIWRFPYVTGENGGAAFVLIYLACAFAIGVPILIAELMVGRRGQSSPPGSMKSVATQEGRSGNWRLVGDMGVLAAYMIVITYAAVVGWVLWYLYKAALTGFSGFDAAAAQAEFSSVTADPFGMIIWTVAGLFVTGAIVFAGVKNGIERAVTILMPLLFLLLLVLAGFNIALGGMGEALTWLFTPDFSKIDSSVFLVAIGQAFFSIGVAMGGMMTFGSYLPRSISIPGSTLIVVGADTMVALLAGLVIFPIVFNNGLSPDAGAGLIFQTLPVAFATMPFGYVFSIMFFLLLAVAGITSMVGLIETTVSWVEDQYGMSRHNSVFLVVGSVAAFAVVSVLGYNVLADVSLLGKGLNDLADYISNQILLPLGGLLIAVFVAWRVSKRTSVDELGLGDGPAFNLWHFLLRFIVPPAVAIIFITGIGG